MNMVRYKQSKLPKVTEKREAELKNLSEQPDTSDIPTLNETFWKNATQGRFYRPVKKQTSVRIDADVMAWLKEPGKGYQTRMNAILREAMMRDLCHKS